MRKKTTQREFIANVKNFYEKKKRVFPWRNTKNPYHILVSEIMLQQTQVARVRVAYPEFLALFPTVTNLASASFSQVLKAWQGMGYNRRARYLHETAKIIAKKHSGKIPQTYEELVCLPGIGQSTAGGILAFAFDIPHVFIETNIRRAYIHHFFPRKKNVRDRELLPIIEKTLDKKNPRVWYYALFDYGAYLARAAAINPNRSSAHYSRQSAFEGSLRQLRGELLRVLLTKPCTENKLVQLTKRTKEEVSSALEALCSEGFIVQKEKIYILEK